MWTTLALVAGLSSVVAESDQLKLVNVQPTYGTLGAERTDTKLLPGDIYFLSFDVEGLKADGDGKVRYAQSVKYKNSQGKVVYGQEPQPRDAYAPLGGARLHLTTLVNAQFDQPPGEYTVTVTISDPKTKASATETRKFEILPKNFGLVQLNTAYYDVQGGMVPAPPGGVPGQFLTVSFAAVGFDRDSGKKQPDVAVEMRVLDEGGKPTVANPFKGEVNQDVPDTVVLLPMTFTMALNRPGKFTVELKGTDRLSKKTAKLSFPLTVVDLKHLTGSEQK
jgi:hypothetical protein